MSHPSTRYTQFVHVLMWISRNNYYLSCQSNCLSHPKYKFTVLSVTNDRMGQLMLTKMKWTVIRLSHHVLLRESRYQALGCLLYSIGICHLCGVTANIMQCTYTSIAKHTHQHSITNMTHTTHYILHTKWLSLIRPCTLHAHLTVKRRVCGHPHCPCTQH